MRRQFHTPIITRIEYLYRDASNYKFWGHFYLSGRLELEQLRPYLFQSEWFIPEAVGMRSLVPSQRNRDDHLLHELWEISSADLHPTVCTVEELVTRFKAASNKDWFGALPAQFAYSSLL